MSIVKKEHSSTIVFDFQPKEFPLAPSKQADDFVNKQLGKSSDFIIDPLVAEQVGVAELDRRNIETRVEAQALERLKEVEEKAYKEAYSLGLDEGREKAFLEHNDEFVKRIEGLDALLKAFENVKQEIMDQNEVQFVRLCYQVACKIAMREIEGDDSIILDVISKVIHEAQTEDNVVITVSKDDFNFLENLRKRNDKKTDFLKNVKLEPSENILSGGCNLDSNYGSIDSSIKQRVEKAWTALEARLPRIKSSSKKDEE